MAVLQISDVMCLCVFLHFTTGCSESSPYISCSPGESVLLHCGDGNTRHTHIQWRHAGFDESQNSVDVIQDPRYKDRVQIHGNLSLSISRLTVDDSGLYRCDLTAHVQLIIEGCFISGTETSVAMRRYSGESVFLSCLVECSTRFKPDEFIWKFPNHSRINQTTELSRLYQGRVHMFDVDSGDFSLLISNLTERDEGLYVCWINDNQQKSFSLTIKDVSRNPLIYSLMLLICLMLLLATGFICRRFTPAKKGRRGSRVSQSPDHQDDVTYSSAIRIKGGKRTCRKEEVVYSSVADVRNGRSAQDDVIYSEEAGREDIFVF